MILELYTLNIMSFYGSRHDIRVVHLKYPAIYMEVDMIIELYTLSIMSFMFSFMHILQLGQSI